MGRQRDAARADNHRDPGIDAEEDEEHHGADQLACPAAHDGIVTDPIHLVMTDTSPALTGVIVCGEGVVVPTLSLGAGPAIKPYGLSRSPKRRCLTP